MRSRFWARLLLVLMLAVAMPLGPARAAQAATAPVLEVRSVTVPSSVKAGTTLTVEMDVRDPSGEAGVGGGTLSLSGPAKQILSMKMQKVGETRLRGQLELSPNTAPGTWTISLSLFNQDGEELRLNKESGWVKTIAVESSGSGADNVGPDVLEVAAPAEAVMGDLITLTAKVKDDLSGVARVYALVQPTKNLGGEKPLWLTQVELYPTGTPGEFAGNMLADYALTFGIPQTIVRVQAADKAGNLTDLKADALAQKGWKMETAVREMPKVAEGLKTSPYLNLLHPGEMAFWNWLEIDRTHLLDLLAQGGSNPTNVRKALAAEIPMLRASLDGLRKELYTDPNTGVKVAPYATTGKWMVLGAALEARTEVLLELERKEGLLNESFEPLTAQELSSFYNVLGEGERWATLENGTQDLLAQIPAAMLKVLAQSPEAVKVVNTPAWESWFLSPLDDYDRNVIYFKPVFTGRRNTVERNSGEFFVPVTVGAQFTDQMKDLFYAIGQHFGDAYMAAPDAPEFKTEWESYTKLRVDPIGGGNGGFFALAYYNIGDDFATAYMPFDLGRQYNTAYQVYSDLRQNPATMESFKQIVAGRLAKTPATLAVTPSTFFVVGLSDTPTFTVKGTTAGRPTAEAWGFRSEADKAPNRQMTMTTSASTTTFSMKDAVTPGRQTWYLLQTRASDNRTYARHQLYYRAPVMLDPLPAATNQKTYKVTGTAPVGASVTVNGVSATVSGQGRFAAELALTPGANKVEVAVSGVTLTATYQVLYEPEGTKVPLTVNLAGSSSEKFIVGSGTTAPFATVMIGAQRTQANARGEFQFSVTLTEGANKIAITAASPVGNKATWNGVVVSDTTPPVLTVAIPKLTNVPIFKLTGKTDPNTTVTVNGEVVVAGADGSFGIDVKLAAGQATKVEVVATDSAGNRVTQTGEIAYSAGVPGVTRQDSVLLYGKVAQGTKLTYKGNDVTVGPDGGFELRVDVPAGRNVYTLTNTSGDKTVGVVQFVVINPLKVFAPVDLGDGKVKVSGKTVPGYVILVDGQLAAVDANGDWTVTVERGGKSNMKVTADGDGQSYAYNLILP